MPARRFSRSALLAASVFAAAAVAPAIALGDTQTSSNWSGYAAHRAGVKFRRVRASWVQPAVVCKQGQTTYSSFWVGLGGFSQNANGLEQIGTENDCTAAGQHRSSVWYELVPAPSRPVSMTVKQGDHLSASVTVVGRRVTMRLVNHTRKETFSRHLTTQSIDVTSADWIAEAPSTCNGAGFCRTLPLANFGAANFTASSAQTAEGQVGAIASPLWDRTRIVLSQGASPFTGLDTRRSATPSALQSGGTAFAVHYKQSQAVGVGAARTSAAGMTGTAVQPGGVRR